MDDSELLKRYAKDGCAQSFGVIVRRHIDWVYAASLRQVGEAALAEDVTQSVFVLLARRAGEMHERVILRGWLFNTLRFVAREARRQQGRRRRHEARVAVDAGAAAKSDDPGDSAWEQMAPMLDEAVTSLRESDRQAILLRFYEGINWKDPSQLARLAKMLEAHQDSMALPPGTLISIANFSATPTPEPGLVMVGVGLLVCAMGRRRRGNSRGRS